MPETMFDEELAQGLKQARKTPRSFALIYKGANPLKLLVRKKKFRDSEANKIKTEEKGSGFAIGVVQGEGPEMVFLVTGEEPPVKPTKLKALISETAELAIKPRFQVVEELPELADEEEEGASAEDEDAPSSDSVPPVAPPAPEPTAAQAPPPAPPPPPAAVDAKQLLAAMNKIGPQIQAAVAANPARKAEFLQPVAAFQQHLKSADLTQAKAVLGQLVDLLKSSAPAGKVSLVKLGKSRLEWIGVRDAAVADVRKLQAALEAEFGNDADQSQSLQAALAKLNDSIRKLEAKLAEELDQVLNADEAGRPALVQVARKTMGDLTSYLDSDPILAELDDNEVVPGMKVVAPIRSKLSEISAALG